MPDNKPASHVVTQDYETPYPDSIPFAKGERVRVGKRSEDDADWTDWFWCEGEQGNQAWVPLQFMELDAGAGYGTMTVSYDARELTIRKGEVLEILEELNGFARARNADGLTGWVPRKNLAPAVKG